MRKYIAMMSSASPAIPGATAGPARPADVSTSEVDFSLKEFPLLDRVKILPPATRDEIIQKKLCTRKMAIFDFRSNSDNPVESEPGHLSKTDWDSVQLSLKCSMALCRALVANAQKKAEQAAKNELQYICHGVIKDIAKKHGTAPSRKIYIECMKCIVHQSVGSNIKTAEQLLCAKRRQFLIDLWLKPWSEEYVDEEVTSQSKQIMYREKNRRTNQFIHSVELQDNQTHPIENTDNEEPLDREQLFRRAKELRTERDKADNEMLRVLITHTDLQYTKHFFDLGKSIYARDIEPSDQHAECH